MSEAHNNADDVHELVERAATAYRNASAFCDDIRARRIAGAELGESLKTLAGRLYQCESEAQRAIGDAMNVCTFLNIIDRRSNP